MSKISWLRDSSHTCAQLNPAAPLSSTKALIEILVEPGEELLLSHANVLTHKALEMVLASLISSLQAKGVLFVPAGVLHSVDLLELFPRDSGHCTPPLTLTGPHHSVKRALHPHKFLCLGPVSLVCWVDGILVVPLSKLGVLQITRSIDTGGVTEIVSLEKNALRERIVCEKTQHLCERLAHATNDWELRTARWEGTDTSVDATDGHKIAHGRIIVLGDVATDHIVALREAKSVESVGELGVCLHLLGEEIDRGV